MAAMERDVIDSVHDKSESETQNVNFEEIVRQIGEFGRYQKIWYVVAILPAICVPFAPMMTIFALAEQNHRCVVPGLSNDTFAIQSESHEVTLNMTIPRAVKDENIVFSQCTVYVDQANDTNTTQASTVCDEWVYDTDQYHSTIISDLNLVCDQKILRSHLGMIFFGGVVVGAFVMGAIGDRFGRRMMICVGLTILFVGHVAVAWAPNFAVLAALRFLVGMGNIGYWDGAMILGLELVGPSKRKLTGLWIEISWCVGEFILLGLAYAIRNWRNLQLTLAVPIVVFLSYWWFIPESPRWLLSKGRNDEAFRIIRQAAKTNKVPLCMYDFSNISVKTKTEEKAPILSLISSPVILLHLIVISLNWFAVSFGYMGLSLNVGNLGGNVYVNFLISIIMEIVAYLLCIVLLDKIGRRRLHCASMLIGGIACSLTLFTTQFGDASLHWLTVTLSMIGKLGSSAAYGVVYVYTTELFPTSSRSRILGICEFSAKLGAMVCPYIVDLGLFVGGDFSQALPLVIFGSVTTFAGVIALLLPETLGEPLPETIEDSICIGKKEKLLIKSKEEITESFF